jgi:hypothetical protein
MFHHNADRSKVIKESDSYYEFLKQKETVVADSGFDPEELNANLFDFQRDIVAWALRKGKAALFEDTGLGKTIQQLSWADAVAKHENGSVLILAPLAVGKQTAKEADKFGIQAKLCESDADVENGINITNYEKLHKFNTDRFCGIVLDESSILKSYSGKTTNDLIRRFRNTKYKLACTATPSPNDFTELGNHAEFLNVTTMNEMLSMFFINDSSNGIGWRLKRHSVKEFFKWIAEWAIMIKSPADLGFDGTKYILPKLNIHTIVTETAVPEGQLFVMPAETLQERRQARKESLDRRVKKANEIVESDDGQVLIWCNYNDESDALRRTINGSYEVKGSDTDLHKEAGMLGFSDGSVHILVSKPSICGFGMNWQNCHRIIFCGLSDSYEQFYQAIRRCWRFGQKHEVDVYVIIGEAETTILNNIQRKQANHVLMSSEMLETINTVTKEKLYNLRFEKSNYKPQETMSVPGWLNG